MQEDPAGWRGRLLAPVMRAVEQGGIDVIISTMTVTELLVGPLRAGDRLAEGRARLFLSTLCRIVPVDVGVAETAARLRALSDLQTPDALICATGLVAGTDAVIGNDAGWKRLARCATCISTI